MDQHQSQARGRSPSRGEHVHQQQPNIRNGHSPSPARFPNPVEDSSNSTIGLGLGIESAGQQYPSDFSFNPSNSFLSNQQQPQPYQPPQTLSDSSGAYDINQDFTQQLKGEDTSYGGETQGSFSQSLLGSNFGDADFTIFPPTPADQFNNTPLFVGENQPIGGADGNMMSTHHSTPPHLLKPDANQPGSANHSPSFNQHQFSSPPGGHSRNASLGPEAAFLSGQIDWSQGQFQGHRRSPSEYSDVSSVAPSPNLVSVDTFDQIEQGHSPMHRPQDAGIYEGLHGGISNFSISDHAPHGTHSPNHHNGRSPSHSPAISPRLLPQQMPEMHQQQTQYLLQTQNSSFGPPASYGMQSSEAFPPLSQGGADIQVPDIQVDYAPNAGVGQPNKSALDAESLVPPDRGRPKQRQRAVTDPFNSGGQNLGHHRTPSASSSLSPNVSGRSEASRSLSPLERGGSGAGGLSPSPNRQRRQSTSSVPNNVIALRLADPEYTGSGAQDNGPGGPKRVQKHPATFQCTLCPKRFTRAYNLRSHLRTHTDERPFVCTVCGKAFARQHDRKRHEGLHSGEKKFVCKGELKAGGLWGCGRRFARADALGRHFRSEAGRICIKPLLDEEMQERHRQWNEQRMQQQAQQQGMVMQQQPPQGMMMAPPGMDPNAFPMAPTGHFGLPQALIAQYPALAGLDFQNLDMGGGGGMDDDLSGGSGFENSDYDEAEEGYVSGPGTGFGQGGMNEGFGEMGYASDYGGR